MDCIGNYNAKFDYNLYLLSGFFLAKATKLKEHILYDFDMLYSEIEIKYQKSSKDNINIGNYKFVTYTCII